MFGGDVFLLTLYIYFPRGTKSSSHAISVTMFEFNLEFEMKRDKTRDNKIQSQKIDDMMQHLLDILLPFSQKFVWRHYPKLLLWANATFFVGRGAFVSVCAKHYIFYRNLNAWTHHRHQSGVLEIDTWWYAPLKLSPPTRVHHQPAFPVRLTLIFRFRQGQEGFVGVLVLGWCACIEFFDILRCANSVFSEWPSYLRRTTRHEGRRMLCTWRHQFVCASVKRSIRLRRRYKNARAMLPGIDEISYQSSLILI